MAKMERVESENRSHPHPNAETGAALGYRGYSNDYKLEVKPTGSSQSPYVGIVRYSEQEYACTDKAATKCEISSTMPVTEIFRFQNGHWVY